MKIIINQKPVEISQCISLEGVLSELNLSSQGMALALNQSIIPQTQWAQTQVGEGDEIDLFQVIAGG